MSFHSPDLSMQGDLERVRPEAKVIGVTATQTSDRRAATIRRATTMEFARQIQHAALAALAAALALMGAKVHAETSADGEQGGVRLQVDNDLFAGGERD